VSAASTNAKNSPGHMSKAVEAGPLSATGVYSDEPVSPKAEIMLEVRDNLR